MAARLTIGCWVRHESLTAVDDDAAKVFGPFGRADGISIWLVGDNDTGMMAEDDGMLVLVRIRYLVIKMAEGVFHLSGGRQSQTRLEIDMRHAR